MSSGNAFGRRKFLGRSAMGAGGLLLSSMLLQSCTDHNIPDPQSPLIPLPLGESIKPDWNEDAKLIVSSGLAAIPEVGEILSLFTDLFWPKTGENVWSEVREKVEALIDQKIADNAYQDVSIQLSGLQTALINYNNEVRDGTPGEILSEWIDMKNAFDTRKGVFQQSQYMYELLPLFVQYANMYLALLRDAVIGGKSWGRTDADHQQDISNLKNTISEFTTYVNNVYTQVSGNLIAGTKTNFHLCEPFRTLNAFERAMTLLVHDHTDTWPYYDVIQYPNGFAFVSTRVIYSDPMGTADESGLINIATPLPTQLPTNLTVWSGDRVNAVQLTYPAGSGPGGVTQTKRMGTQNSGSSQSYTLSSASNPIVQANVTWGDIVNTMQFFFYDGSTTANFGRNGGSNGWGWQFDNHALISIHINGVSGFYESADCIVFGFSHWDNPKIALHALKSMYIKSPRERSVAELAKAFPKFSIPAGFITEELKAARKAHWN